MSSEKYFVINFNHNNEIDSDFLYELIEQFSVDGVEEFSLEEKQVDEILGERAYSGGDVPLSVIDEVDTGQSKASKFFFFGEGANERAHNLSLHLESLFGKKSFNLSSFDYDDWDTEWRKFYRPIVIDENLTIVPEWMKSEETPDKNSVFIYPGRGFGTGNHETTFLCLKLFTDFISKGSRLQSLLDFGCGSGILGIAALRLIDGLGVDFVDIDPDALDNCLQNLSLNFQDKDLSQSTLVLRDRFGKEPKKYDLVFANILENILILEKDILENSLSKNGILIVSGILENQVETIINEYKNFNVVSVLAKNDWRAIGFTKK